MNQPALEPRYQFFDGQPSLGDVREEVLLGFQQTQKTISAKFFYDEIGSGLFEQITELPEYYLTRTELGLLSAYEDALCEQLQGVQCVVEYGSGSNLKIRRLLEIAQPLAYVPVDISSEHLQANAKALHADFPNLAVYPLCADFTQTLDIPQPVKTLAKTAFFPGSSIGNFEPNAARQFLANVATSVGPGGQLLIGVDCKKDPAVLERAYDDAAGVTARFNLNMLTHLNEVLGADFDVQQFRHLARYDIELGRIEMYLESLIDQSVTVDGTRIEFAQGERIHTENSYKYAPNEFVALAQRAGFALQELWLDERQWFGLYLLEVR